MGKKLHGNLLLFLFFVPVLVWGQCPTSVSISSNTGNTICEGTNVTYTATPNGGTGPYTYQWKIDNVNQGGTTNSNTFSSTTLTNGQVVSVEVTEANSTSCSISNNGSPITVNTTKTPTVNFNVPAGNICMGNLKLTASNTNAGTNPTYEWYVDGNLEQSSGSKDFTYNYSTDKSYSVKVVLNSNYICPSPASVEVTKTVTISPDATISSSNTDLNSACLNQPITPIVFNIGGSATGASVSGLPPGLSGSYSNGTFTISGSPTSSGNFNYTVTTQGPCSNASQGGTIEVVKDATISLSSGSINQEVCQSQNIENIVYLIGETGNGATVNGLPAGISGSYSGGNFTISGSSTQVGVYNYSIFATGSCGSSSMLNGTITINENLTPSVSITSSDADNIICEGTEVIFTASATNAGNNPQYQWKVNGIDRGSPTNSNTFNITDLSNADAVTVELTSSEGCTTSNPVLSNSIATEVNLNLTPEVTISASDSDICPGDEVIFSIATISNEGLSPTYQWKLDGVIVGTNSPTFNTTNLTDGQSVSLIITSSETCLATTTATSNVLGIEVFPPAPAKPGNISGEIEVCSSATGLTYSVPPVENAETYNWIFPSGWNITSGAGTNSVTVNAGTGSGNISVKASNTCGDSSTESTLAVTSVNGVPANPGNITSDLGGNNNICPPYDINFSVAASGTFKWTIPAGWTLLNGTGTNSVNVRINDASTSGIKEVSVVATNICGNSAPSTYGGIVVDNHIVADFGPDQTICKSQNSIVLNGNRSFGDASLDVNFSTSGGGTFSNGPGGNNKNGPFQVTYTPSTNDKTDGQVILTMTVPEPKGNSNNGNKCGESSDSIILNFTPDATISDPSNKAQDICINTPLENISFNIGGGATGATISGLPPGVSGNFSAGVFTVSGSPTLTGNYSYTVSSTGNCASQQTTRTGTINVLPNNTIAAAANKDQTVCINQPIAAMEFPVNSTVTSVNTSNLPNGITGSIIGGNFILSGTPDVSGTFEYSLETVGTCETATTTGTITVNPDVTITDPANIDQTVCINSPISEIQFEISSPGSGASVTGLPQGLIGNFSNGIFTISGSPTEAGAIPGENGIFNYTVQTEGECEQATSQGTITVIPDPTATISYPENICTSIGGSVNVNLDGTGNYSGGTYSATPAGLTISSSSGAITPGSSDPGTYLVTYNGPENCNPAVATVEVTIIAEPFVEISYEDPFCNSDTVLKEPIFSNGVGNYQNGTFSSSQPGGLIIDPNTGEINAQTSGPGTYDVLYTISADSSCNEVVVTTEVTITQNPQINISYPETICSSETAIPVVTSGEDGDYEGGVYSGSNGLSISTDGTINPSESIPGPHTVTYSIPSNAGCDEVVATAEFTIKEVPIITTDPVNTGVCSNSPAEFEVIASGDDLTYQWYRILEDGTEEMIAGENEAILNFSNVTAVDALQYYVIVSGDDSCVQDTSEIVTLNVDEDITITEPSQDITICEDSQDEISFLFRGHANGAILDFDWYKDGNIVNPVSNKIEIGVTGPDGPNGEYTGTLTIIDPEAGENGDSGVYYVVVDGPDYFTCPEATSKTFTFRVDPRPEAPTVSNQQFCLNEDAGNLTASGEDGNEIKWYTFDSSTSEYTFIGNTIPIETSNPTTFEYYATQTRPNGCESDYSEMLTIDILETPPPVSEEVIKFEYCHNEQDVQPLEVIPADGAEINWYASIDAETALSEAPTPSTNVVNTTTYYVSQTFVSTTGCESDRTPVEVRIKEIPNVIVDIVGDENTICLGSSIDFTATGAETYTWYLGELELQSGATATYQATPTTLGENKYTVVGTTEGCSNSYEISVFVDDNTVIGNLNAPERICISNGTAEVSLESRTGDIIKWEYKNASTADVWTETADIDLSDTRIFSGLTETTSYRVTVKNGVCDEATSETTIIVDQLPEGGKALWAKNTDRLFLTCQNPVPGYASRLNLSEYSGEVLGWEYRGVSDNSWTTINSTLDYLTPDEIENVITNESTAFRAIIGNNSCNNTYSETAIVSVIEADIKPTPVEVDKDVICIGDEISLSSETGYSSEGGKLDGGAFDNAGIKNNGWDFTNPNGGSNDFDSGANNGRADHWLRMNPHGSDPQENEKVYTANLYPIESQSPTNGSMVNFRTFSTNEGNKGFALVTGNNDSFMETPVFSLGGLDEAILTWDQAYNLTEGARIRVEISTNGGGSYETVLFDITGTATSGNYNNFGDLTPELRPLNKMVVDLGAYLGQSNLRIRFNYEGTIDGDVWAVDNIEVPEGPQDVILQWYYDDDLNDPDNYLEPIGAENQSTVTFIPRKIGWNDFEVQTRIILDSNGDQCQSIENFETIRVWAFDRYTTNVATEVGSCGSLSVQLNATVYADYQAKNITEYPTLDGYLGSWQVEDLNGNTVTTGFEISNQDPESTLDPINNPQAIFTAENLGDYNFKWILTPTEVDENGNLIDNSGCPPVENPSNVTLVDCTTLDFDGDDDYIDLGNNYNGSYFIEAWIRPFDRPIDDGGSTDASTGVIFSSSGFEINMENLPSTIQKNSRWYHIAVSNGGDLWVDGVASGKITVNGSGINNTSIGARYNAGTKTTSNHFSGWIDELRIWKNAPQEREIRFMMNQRIKLNDNPADGTPIEGEVVPNRSVAGSYLTNNGNNMYFTGYDSNNKEILVTFYDQTWGDLAGYYRLISDDPDPLNLTDCVTFDDNLKPIGGYTPDHSINKIPGRLVNITTNQENTSPTPYCSGSDGTWASINTWARPTVWDYPNSSYDGTALDWNIARINHNITSDSKEIIMLGLLSETPGKLLSINGDHAIRITHYLLLDGNMDLIDDSQLLQDHGSILDNSSGGWAEIDQKGRKSSFNYNYWTSPFSDQGSNNNSGFMIENILFDGTNTNIEEPAINFTPGYFSADGGITSPITISNEWIWDFRGGDADIYGDWLHLGSDYLEIAGAGFSMKGTTGDASLSDKQNYTFRGKPNNGNIPTDELYLESDQNFLVGNPYPSAIDAYEFIKDNIPTQNQTGEEVFNGSIYLWDHFSGKTHILAEYVGGYAVINLSSPEGIPAISNDWRINFEGEPVSNVLPERIIPVAQGFFLNSAPVGTNTFSGDIIFKNTQRVFQPLKSGVSIFLQQEEDIIKGQSNTKSEEDTRMKIRLKYESPKGYHRQILVTSDENTSNGFDIGYDAPLIENNLEDMYWWFENHGFVIQGVPDFANEQILPLAVKTKEGGEFKIKIDATENWPKDKELYLKDNVLDTIHDILKEDYIGKIEGAGEITDRFELVFFKEKALDPDDILNPDLPILDGIVGISYSRFDKQVKISNFDLLDVNKVMIFDLGGKLIQEFDELPTEKEIRLRMRPVRSGVYIVKVFCENGICNKKIIIE